MGRQPETVTVVLRLDRDTDRIGGTLDDGHGVRCAFDGWLDLGTLLEAVRQGKHDSAAESEAGDANT